MNLPLSEKKDLTIMASGEEIKVRTNLMAVCYDLMLNYVKDKDVLDIGSCGNQGEEVKTKTLYNLIKAKAKFIQGVDLESNTPEIIKDNAETINLARQFDVVTAGDVIEHIHNPGLFLDNMHRHLKKNGLLLVVTPNVKSFAYLFFRGNKYHTCWYCRHTLQYLVQSHGFKVEKIIVGLRRRRNLLYDPFRYVFANNIMFVCRKIEK